MTQCCKDSKDGYSVKHIFHCVDDYHNTLEVYIDKARFANEDVVVVEHICLNKERLDLLISKLTTVSSELETNRKE